MYWTLYMQYPALDLIIHTKLVEGYKLWNSSPYNNRAGVVSVSTVTRQWAGRPGFDFWQGQGFFSHHVQTGSGAHPASYTMETSSQGVKWPVREADHSPSTSVEIKNVWRYSSSSRYVFMAYRLFKHRDNFGNRIPAIQPVASHFIYWLILV